jgi:hypothetical protein
MANTFLQIMLDDLEDGIRRKIHNFVVGLVPKPVRKIVGLNTRGPLAKPVLSMGSVPTDPLQPLATGCSDTEGFRIDPCNLSESVC